MPATHSGLRVYNDDGDSLMEPAKGAPRITIVRAGDPRAVSAERKIRLQWGQHLLDDVVDGRYRTVICGVNDSDNGRGVLGEILKLVPTSQWTLASATSYAKVFRNALQLHAREDREPYVLKFDLDRLLVLALLRPTGRDHFNLEDLYRGFRTISRMLEGRHDRRPVASVSFLGAKSNRLLDHSGGEPSLEAVLHAMHSAGFDGDVYPPVGLWETPVTGVFARFPFPESVDQMRQGNC